MTSRLRLDTFVVEPRERVLRPWLASSLFPQLPGRSRTPFRIGLVVLLALLATFALLRWQAPMIAIAAFGFPMLFLAYLPEIDVFRRVPLRMLLLAAALGAALGAGWAYLAGTVFADGYDVALGFEVAAGPNVGRAVAVSIIEVLLMLLPAAIVRMVFRSPLASLDGYVVGSAAATAFTAAATVIFLLPQLTAGLVADGRSLDGILVEAGIQGAAMPLASVAVGGAFGIALWFTGGRAAVAVVLCALVLFTGFGLLDVSPFSNTWYVAGYLVISVLAMLGLRVAIQAAVRSESLRATTVPEGRPANTARVLGTAFSGVAAIAVITTVVALAMTPGVAPYRCPPECGRPPIGEPVETNPRYTADDGAFSVNHPGEGSAYRATYNPNGIVLRYVGGDTGTLVLFGEPAENRPPKDIAQALIEEKYPNATVSYEIPNASVGYQPGYGVAADEYPQNSAGKYARLRIIVLVAVKHDYALIAAAVGPYRRFTPDYGSGHPSPANLELARDMGKYVNSFRWRGDREVGGS